MKVSKITKEELIKLVNISINFTDLTTKYKEKYNCGCYNQIYNKIKELNINTSHFETQSERRKKYHPRKNQMINIIDLTKNSNVDRCTIKGFVIRNNIIPYVCQSCGCNDQWLNKTMSLILDHINGINNDHRKENLRFLCPNCNSIQNTFCGRNKKSNKRKYKE